MGQKELQNKIQCKEDDWEEYIKICNECGGDVHAHFEGESNDDVILSVHCHKCGKTFNDYEFYEELKRYEQ